MMPNVLSGVFQSPLVKTFYLFMKTLTSDLPQLYLNLNSLLVFKTIKDEFVDG